MIVAFAARLASIAFVVVVIVLTLSVIAVATLVPLNFTVAPVNMPTSRFDAVTGDNVVFEAGSFVSLTLNVFALSS